MPSLQSSAPPLTLEEAEARIVELEREVCALRAAAGDGNCVVTAPASEVSAPWQMVPIGFVESAFVSKNGTPRQSGIVPAAPARLRVLWGTNPSHSLEGLGGFSHAWLLWVFDRNGGAAVKAKVRPPRLGGAPTGVFGCRTPHRPNPVGLSLVSISRVDGSTLYFDGADLCDGTPVLDIKPFVPSADAPPPFTPVRAAPWVTPWGGAEPAGEDGGGGGGEGEGGEGEGGGGGRGGGRSAAWGCRVAFSELARQELRALCAAEPPRGQPQTLRFFRCQPEQAEAAFVQALAADPRSIYRKEKCAGKTHSLPPAFHSRAAHRCRSPRPHLLGARMLPTISTSTGSTRFAASRERWSRWSVCA